MRLCCAAVIVALAVPARAVWGQSFAQMVVFGDSLSDTGNVSNATFGISPGSNYFNGRYSNGVLWHEVMAGSLGVSAATPSRTGGRNYAHGGVRTGSGNTSFFPFSFPNVGTQINQFLGGGTPNANQIFTVLAGGNDFLDNLSQNPSTIVTNLVNHVTALNNAGARFIVVPNLPLLGETPRYNTTASRTAYNNLTANFNAQLATALTNLDAQIPAKIYQFDLADTFGQILSNPGSFGLVNVTQRALVNGTVVPNPDDYLFYDDVHPTRVGHRLLASGAFDLVTTHAWTAGSGDWSSAANWEVAGVPSANWIAAIENRSPVALTVSLPVGSAGTAVRRVRVAGPSAGATLMLAPSVGLSASESVALNGGATLELGPASLLTTSAVAIAPAGALRGSGRVTGDVSSAGLTEARVRLGEWCAGHREPDRFRGAAVSAVVRQRGAHADAVGPRWRCQPRLPRRHCRLRRARQ
jgi:phospholipase/lecithinase/hemolysin